jgi:hypothetical protein
MRMVSTLGTDKADSDENAADDYQPCTIAVELAREHAQALSEFAMSRPDLFGAQHGLPRQRRFSMQNGRCRRYCQLASNTRPFRASLRSDSVNTVVVSMLLWCHEAALCLSNVQEHSTRKFQILIILCTIS